MFNGIVLGDFPVLKFFSGFHLCGLEYISIYNDDWVFTIHIQHHAWLSAPAFPFMVSNFIRRPFAALLN